MTRRFLTDGESEIAKASWHGAIGTLAIGAALYNAAACIRRPSAHLAIGAIGYTLATVIEVQMVLRHLDAHRSRP